MCVLTRPYIENLHPIARRKRTDLGSSFSSFFIEVRAAKSNNGNVQSKFCYPYTNILFFHKKYAFWQMTPANAYKFSIVKKSFQNPLNPPNKASASFVHNYITGRETSKVIPKLQSFPQRKSPPAENGHPFLFSKIIDFSDRAANKRASSIIGTVPVSWVLKALPIHALIFHSRHSCLTHVFSFFCHERGFRTICTLSECFAAAEWLSKRN